MSPAPRILLPFLDDSTLFFARAMRALLAAEGARPVMARIGDAGDLSDRQLQQVLPEGPDITIAAADLAAGPAGGGRALAGFDAVVTCRVMQALFDLMAAPGFRDAPQRPAIVAFTGGLDFSPQRGFANRLGCDVVFVQSAAAVDAYRSAARAAGVRHWQHVGFGHPFLMVPGPDAARPDQIARRSEVWFFAQAISPRTRPGRVHMLRVLAAIARHHPDRQVWLKLRHLPGENAAHLHREAWPYPDLMADLPGGCPPNLGITACTMDEALSRAGLGITCTSTAAADLLQANIPTMVHLDFIENYLDPLVPAMRRMFAGSGLMTPLERVLALQPQAPAPGWLAGFLCPRDLGAQVLAAIAAFHASRSGVLPPG
jgi:hypothetical protein